MNTTLDQWEVLRAVIQYGGFAAAATRLNRSQSTISYALARLEEQTGVRIFELVGRKAQLTEAGRTLLNDVEPLLAGFTTLEERARFIGLGRATEICLAVDSLYPTQKLFSALEAFTQQFPYVRLKLHQSTFLSSQDALTAYGAHLCITAFISRKHFSLPIQDVRMTAVMRADYPLNQLGRQLIKTDVIRQLAVIIQGYDGTDECSQPHSDSQLYWPVNTIEMAIDAVRSGLCFGWLPVYRIQPYLDSGELVGLRLPAGRERTTHLFLVHANLDSPRLEMNALSDLLGANKPPEII
jgi:DNA-binding transcriptional LysR family regulator